MKILYLHQYFNTPEMKGGTRSYEMALRMVKRGHEVHMITSRKEYKTSGNLWESEVIEGIYVHWLPVKYDNKMPYVRRIFSFFKFAFAAGKKAIVIGGDIIFATSTPLTIAIPAIQAKKVLKVPMVFEVRDLWPELPIAIGALKSPLTKYLAKKLEIWAYKHSDSVVGLSPGMCEGVISTGYPAKKVFNIPNSCDINLFSVEPKQGIDFRAKYDWLGDRPLVIYAGTLGHINGICYLARVAQKMLYVAPEVRFLVIGRGVEEEKLRNEATELGVLGDNFFMLPPMSKNEMPALFSAATISTSLFIPLEEMWANSANKFFDTLASGKPIAINYGGWQKKLIESYGNGLVLHETDYSSAAKELLALLNDEVKLQKTGEASKKMAVDSFSRDVLAKELINLLENLFVGSSAISSEGKSLGAS